MAFAARIAFEDTVGVEGLVEIVRDLGLLEPEVPVGDELILRKVAQIEILLAQELVAKIGHESAPWAGLLMIVRQYSGPSQELSRSPPLHEREHRPPIPLSPLRESDLAAAGQLQQLQRTLALRPRALGVLVVPLLAFGRAGDREGPEGLAGQRARALGLPWIEQQVVADVDQQIRQAVAGPIRAVAPVGHRLAQLPAPGIRIEFSIAQTVVGRDEELLAAQPVGMGENEVLPAVAVHVGRRGVERKPERTVGLRGEGRRAPLARAVPVEREEAEALLGEDADLLEARHRQDRRAVQP